MSYILFQDETIEKFQHAIVILNQKIRAKEFPMFLKDFNSFQTEVKEELKSRSLPNETTFTKSIFEVLTKSLDTELKILAFQNKDMQQKLCVEIFDKMFSAFFSSVMEIGTMRLQTIDPHISYSNALNKLLDESKWKNKNEEDPYRTEKSRIDEDIFGEVRDRFNHSLVSV